MNQLQIFKNSDFGKIRTIRREGDVWFSATDVARALGYANPHDAVIKRCNPVWLAICEVRVITGKRADGTSIIQPRSMKFINVGNIYRLIAGSKLPDAVKFESWIFDDLVPNTLKNGGYLIVKEGDTSETLAQRSRQVLQATIERQEKENKKLQEENEQKDILLAEMTPKVEYCDEALESEHLYSATIVAKSLKMEGAALNKKLHQLGIQYKRCGTWLLYAQYMPCGLAEIRPRFFNRANGKCSSRPMLLWTEKGRKFIYDLIKSGKLK